MNRQIIYLHNAEQFRAPGPQPDPRKGWWHIVITHYQIDEHGKQIERKNWSLDTFGLYEYRGDAEFHAMDKARAMHNVLMALGYSVIINRQKG